LKWFLANLLQGECIAFDFHFLGEAL